MSACSTAQYMPDLQSQDVRPYGFRDDIARPDGSVAAGVMVPVAAWLIEGAQSTILIDTGLGDVAEVAGLQRQHGSDTLVRRSAGQDLVAGLAQHGLSPEDVDTVILTHLHYDHIGNDDLFTRARFVVQQQELDLAREPKPYRPFYYATTSTRSIRSQIGSRRSTATSSWSQGSR